MANGVEGLVNPHNEIHGVFPHSSITRVVGAVYLAASIIFGMYFTIGVIAAYVPYIAIGLGSGALGLVRLLFLKTVEYGIAKE